jgi:hypothetical protein
MEDSSNSHEGSVGVGGWLFGIVKVLCCACFVPRSLSSRTPLERLELSLEDDLIAPPVLQPASSAGAELALARYRLFDGAYVLIMSTRKSLLAGLLSFGIAVIMAFVTFLLASVEPDTRTSAIPLAIYQCQATTVRVFGLGVHWSCLLVHWQELASGLLAALALAIAGNLLYRRLWADYLLSSVKLNPRLSPEERKRLGVPLDSEVVDVDAFWTAGEHSLARACGWSGLAACCQRAYRWDSGVFRRASDKIPETRVILSRSQVPDGESSSWMSPDPIYTLRQRGPTGNIVDAAAVAATNMLSPGIPRDVDTASLAASQTARDLGLAASPDIGRRSFQRGLANAAFDGSIANDARMFLNGSERGGEGGNSGGYGRKDVVDSSRRVSKFAAGEYLSPEQGRSRFAPRGKESKWLQSSAFGETSFQRAVGLDSWSTRAKDGPAKWRDSTQAGVFIDSFGVLVVPWESLPSSGVLSLVSSIETLETLQKEAIVRIGSLVQANTLKPLQVNAESISSQCNRPETPFVDVPVSVLTRQRDVRVPFLRRREGGIREDPALGQLGIRTISGVTDESMSVDEMMHFMLRQASEEEKRLFQVSDVPKPWTVEARLIAVSLEEMKKAGTSSSTGGSVIAHVRSNPAADRLRKEWRERLNMWAEKEGVESWLRSPAMAAYSPSVSLQRLRLWTSFADTVSRARKLNDVSESVPLADDVSDNRIIVGWMCSYLDAFMRETLGNLKSAAPVKMLHTDSLIAWMSDDSDPFGTRVEPVVESHRSAAAAPMGGDYHVRDTSALNVAPFSLRFVRSRPPESDAEVAELVVCGHPVIVLRDISTVREQSGTESDLTRGGSVLRSRDKTLTTVFWAVPDKSPSSWSSAKIVEIRCPDAFSAFGLFFMLLESDCGGWLQEGSVPTPPALGYDMFGADGRLNKARHVHSSSEDDHPALEVDDVKPTEAGALPPATPARSPGRRTRTPKRKQW